MSHPIRVCLSLILAALALACGGAPFAAADDAGAAADDSASIDGAPSDVAQGGDVVGLAGDAGGIDGATPDGRDDVAQLDAGADVVAAQGDAGALDAGPVNDAGPCTPLRFPLAPPTSCAADYGPAIAAAGRVWLVQPQATPAACWSYALAGAAACERCAETFTCACLAAALGDAGAPWAPTHATCHDGAGGATFTE